ncbi:hypothetical protein D8674_028147 [Pyrus ussuriensis x Pyrus communis]|uniref:Uncharacterized protein n=1 Tax=Pyrus ussuriensis x Pyrus communis TaxID=2448454 RepID=A0A5N5IEW5_9ROSA|nr:hypothetical protein D8674_028147 [Pyrus ussuriensis x Pyrus communis]
MDRENHETTVVHSSIALLQERFRELQRVKAMREEREEREISRVLALSSDSEPKQFTVMNRNPAMHNEPTRARLFFHLDHLVHGRGTSASGASLSLWPTLQSKHEDCPHGKTETLLLINLWPTFRDTTSLKTCPNKFEDSDPNSDSDVDTSLHL